MTVKSRGSPPTRRRVAARRPLSGFARSGRTGRAARHGRTAHETFPVAESERSRSPSVSSAARWCLFDGVLTNAGSYRSSPKLRSQPPMSMVAPSRSGIPRGCEFF